MESLELCAGAGGQALGLERAGFSHIGLVEIDHDACETLKVNRPHWNVINKDICQFNASEYKGVDLLAGGLPCPPFSTAGKQLGAQDERNLFPEAIRIVDQVRPKAIMFENVKGLLDPKFDEYRCYIKTQLEKLNYKVDWRLHNASDYGVPQLRPRVIFVAISHNYADKFLWPLPQLIKAKTVGESLHDLMAEDGWKGARLWAERANDVGPTIVGGSKKHGGPDLGPSRARQAWASLGVCGTSIADKPPAPNFVGMPKLTLEMVARIQGFPSHWHLCGTKTSKYRQIGNAFPPPVADAVASQIQRAIELRPMIRISK
jgi:DNA (cytosine-5)-methyltransferase 1